MTNDNRSSVRPEVLGDERLLAFFAVVEAQFEQDIRAGMAPELCRATLVAKLQHQSMYLDKVQALEFLVQLYTSAAAWALAIACLDEHGGPVLQALPPTERDGAADALCRLRLNVLDQSGDREALASALQHAMQSECAKPLEVQRYWWWEDLAELAKRLQAHEWVRNCTVAAHACSNVLNPVDLAVALGTSWHAQGVPAQAHQCAMDALQALGSANYDEGVNHHDWLHLAERVLAFAPDCVHQVIARCLDGLPTHMARPQRRCVEVRIARLQAMAVACQKDITAALEIAHRGNYRLQWDQDDCYGMQVLDWLVQAGQYAQAAAMAFVCVQDNRRGSATQAVQHALDMESGAQHPDVYWHLVLAQAAMENRHAWVCGGRGRKHFFASHLAKAKALAPGHPAVLWLQAFYTPIRHCAGALPLLEQVVQNPLFGNYATVLRLWHWRIRVHGLTQALALAVPLCNNAADNYRLAQSLEPEALSPPVHKPTWVQALRCLQARYFETGQQQFARFFAGAQGAFGDADLEQYSLLCNDLAIWRRVNEHRLDDAISLHHAGMAASPMAEHCEGLVWCMVAKGDDAACVEAAERLWLCVCDHGYSVGNHYPARYMEPVIGALERLGRELEVPVWLERLHSWWGLVRHTNRNDHAALETAYRETMARGLCAMARVQPEDAQAMQID